MPQRTLDLRKAVQEIIETGLIFHDGTANLDNCEILHVFYFYRNLKDRNVEEQSSHCLVI